LEKLITNPKMGIRNYPSAGGNRVNNPPVQFVAGFKQAFESGCASDGATVNVCGWNDGQVACQDYMNMDDMTCCDSDLVAYQAGDCSNPYEWKSGYLCGGGSGDPMTNPCPSGVRYWALHLQIHMDVRTYVNNNLKNPPVKING